MDKRVAEAVCDVFESLNLDSSTKDMHMNKLIDIIVEDFVAGGIQPNNIYYKKGSKYTTVPGWYRPTKNWDITIYHEGNLLGAIELKSLTKAIEKNTNNRIEESIGSPIDLTAAVIEGLLNKGDEPVRKPILGYALIIPSNSVTEATKKHGGSVFGIDSAFDYASLAKRFTIAGRRMLQKGIYDAVWVVKQDLESREVTEPDSQLSYDKFIKTFIAENMIRSAD